MTTVETGTKRAIVPAMLDMALSTSVQWRRGAEPETAWQAQVARAAGAPPFGR